MVYLDHAAATPVSPKALNAMLPFLTSEFFNPSAAYLPAKHVREAFEAAKSEIANFIGAKGNDLVITSGATEANALAFTAVFFGLAAASFFSSGAASTPVSANLQRGVNPRKILVLATEHASVLENARQYHFDTIRVDRTGLIDLSDLRAKLTDDVALVSVALANNELGTIQPLSEISEILKSARLSRLSRGITTPLFLHSDASQGAGLLELNVARLGVDLLTLNAAKLGGPKGVGALYVARGIKLAPFLFGGGQERGLRAGTENVAGVIGFAAAVKELKNHAPSQRKKYISLVENLKSELSKAKIPPLFLGNQKHQLANFLPVSFPGLDAERLIYRLEDVDVYVSTGAACAASKGEPSHVLKAIGLSAEEIAGSLRLSLGVLNTPENVHEAGIKIRSAVDAEAKRLELGE